MVVPGASLNDVVGSPPGEDNLRTCPNEANMWLHVRVSAASLFNEPAASSGRRPSPPGPSFGTPSVLSKATVGLAQSITMQSNAKRVAELCHAHTHYVCQRITRNHPAIHAPPRFELASPPRRARCTARPSDSVQRLLHDAWPLLCGLCHTQTCRGAKGVPFRREEWFTRRRMVPLN